MPGGYKATPHIVRRISKADGTLLYENNYLEPPKVLNDGVVAAMNAMMRDVIDRGTGKNARLAGWEAAGKQVWAIGVDSDQSHLAPDAVLTSMVKRVDLAVYEAVHELIQGGFRAGDVSLGIAEKGVALAPVRVDFPGKAEALAQVAALEKAIAAGELKVPARRSELSAGPAGLVP